MVANLVEFPLEGGGSVVVSTGAPNGRGDAAYGEVVRGQRASVVVDRANASFESVIRKAQPAALAVLNAVSSGSRPPHEVTVEFGIEMSADMGAVIASTAVTANFTVTLKWTRDGGDARED